MNEFEAYVKSDRFSGSPAWRTKLADKKFEGAVVKWGIRRYSEIGPTGGAETENRVNG